MNIRLERIAHALQKIAGEVVVTSAQNREHDFGIISTHHAEISKDLSYVDIFVSSEKNVSHLLEFVRPLSHTVKHRIATEIHLRKLPEIRWRIDTEKQKQHTILSLIHELDQQYGLSRETP